MLVHHASEPYDIAAARAGHHAREKLEALIENGRHRAATVLHAIETQQPRDQLVPTKDLQFDVEPAGIVLRTQNDALDLNPFALGQVADRAGLPRTFLSRLTEPENAGWGPDLAITNLNRLFHARGEADDETSYLVRSLRPGGAPRDEVRGFLSARFKRLDSRPIVAAFADACSQVGAVPIEGYVTPTKIALKAVIAKVYEPVPNEIMSFGVCLENSDYGNGPLALSFFMLRLWCTNYAISEHSLRRIHLGARLAPDITWSAKTLEAENTAIASTVHDVAVHSLGEQHVARLSEGIRRAHEEKIEATKVEAYARKHLAKTEAEAVVAAFNSTDTQNLPAGNTTWRMSNALSWVAGHTNDEERRLELMKEAGAVIHIPEAA